MDQNINSEKLRKIEMQKFEKEKVGIVRVNNIFRRVLLITEINRTFNFEEMLYLGIENMFISRLHTKFSEF